MFLLSNRTDLYKFLFSISVLLLTLFLVMFFLYDDREVNGADNTTYTIEDIGENYSITVDYPRFENQKVTNIVTDYIYEYIKEFKSFTEANKVLDISYTLYYFDNYLNVVFNIENSLNNIKNHNILIDLDADKVSYITNIYDKDYFANEINEMVYHKYSNDIYEKVKESNINNYTYIIFEDKINVYFNNIVFEDLDYIPNITISLTTDTINYEDQEYDESKKFIAFTFDDGPSEYTSEILKTLELNSSSATFFVLGNRIKYYEDTVKEIANSNSEVASHSYSHKYLTEISGEELLKELNSTQIIYKELTDKDIKYLRPPYGNYNESLRKIVQYPLVLWNIDTKDWLVRNSQTISDHILSHASDGSIVLMHDIYPETVEAIKIVIPKLKSLGYEVVSVSDLAMYKEFSMQNGDIIRNMK